MLALSISMHRLICFSTVLLVKLCSSKSLCISSKLHSQCLHLLSAKPTTSLKPASSCCASVSPHTETAQNKSISPLCVWILTPLYCNCESSSIFCNTTSTPHSSVSLAFAIARSLIAASFNLNLGSMFPKV